MTCTCINKNIHSGFSRFAKFFERSIIKSERIYRSSDPLSYGLEGGKQQNIFTNDSSSNNILYHTESPLQILIELRLVRGT
ncbi:MAG: hypothetical protein JO297_11220 [Nitrososphaeraceae archaeon]|nr:hypothetical protein [Nitrososphaeraceae archaeon]